MDSRRVLSDETYRKVFIMAGKVIENYASPLGESGQPLLFLACIMKVMTQETYPLLAKVITTPASEVCQWNANRAGSRICQDWALEDEERPEVFFSDQEKDDLRFNFELYNSSGVDYDHDYNGFHDEMVVSNVIANELRVLEQ